MLRRGLVLGLSFAMASIAYAGPMPAATVELHIVDGPGGDPLPGFLTTPRRAAIVCGLHVRISIARLSII